MKKIFIILFLLIGVFAFSQETIYYNSTPTLQWDAVTEDGEGNPFLPEDIIEYDIYLWDTAGGDITIQPIVNLTHFILTDQIETLLNFPYRANWACAIRVIHTDGDSNIVYSDLAYTVEDIPVTASGPFVYVPLSGTLLAPQGLRDSGI